MRGWIQAVAPPAAALVLSSLIVPYLALDAFLRRAPVPPPGTDGAAAARWLRTRGRPYRAAGWAALVPVAGWLLARAWRAPGGPGAALGTGALLLAGAVWTARTLWRLGLRKQFPHLRPWL